MHSLTSGIIIDVFAGDAGFSKAAQSVGYQSLAFDINPKRAQFPIQPLNPTKDEELQISLGLDFGSMRAACSWSNVQFPCSELSSRLIVARQSLQTCSSDVLLPFYIIAFLSRFLLESCIQQHLTFGIMPALCNFGGRPRVTGPPSTSACMGVLRTGERIGGPPPLALLPLPPCALRIIDIMLSHLRPHLGRDCCGCGQWSFWVEVLVSLRTTPPSMALPAPPAPCPWKTIPESQTVG